MTEEASAIIEALKEGNRRYVSGHSEKHDFRKEITSSASAQSPRAMVLTCMDSRVAPELIFDTHLGDLFDARVAGNVVSGDVIASMKLACIVSTAKVIVVMGHTDCRAIESALNEIELGSFTGLLDKLRPAIDAVKARRGEADACDSDFLNEVARENVLVNLNRIREVSPLLCQKEEEGELTFVGCLYHVETGYAEFL